MNDKLYKSAKDLKVGDVLLCEGVVTDVKSIKTSYIDVPVFDPHRTDMMLFVKLTKKYIVINDAFRFESTELVEMQKC